MKTFKRNTRALGRQQGSVSILVAVSLIALLGIAGLAIDSGLGYMVKARLDSAVDGALVAAPVFGKVMEDAVRLLDISPDNVQNWYTAAPDAGHTVRTGRQAPDGPVDMSNVDDGVPEE